MNIFEFANTEWLYLLLAAPALLLLYWALMLYRRRKLRRFGNETTLRDLMPDSSVARGWIKVVLLALAIVLLGLAAARPRTGSKLRSVETEGREILFVVDVSNSMYAEDPKPSRMERTRYALSRLVKRLTDDRIGIIAFAGEAEVVLPITGDYKIAESKIRSLSPSLITNQGTELGDALQLARISFSSSTRNKSSRLIVLITDGEAHDGAALAVAQEAAAEGIMICSIGIGSPEGVILEIGGRTVEDTETGRPVLTKLNEQLLQQITAATGGIYVRSRNDEFGLERIMEQLDTLETSKFEQRTFEEYDEQYEWFLGAALLILVVEFLLMSRRNPLLRGVHLFERNDKQN